MPQIYVIYRPEDSRKRSREIIENLKKQYGKTNVLSPDFDGYVDVYQIERDVQKSHYLLVIIGNYWGEMVDENGQNLLKSVYDPVHMAIATAISAHRRTIPILVDGASMPRSARLPRELRPITILEAIKIGKNDNISKALSKGLKNIIKRNSLSRLPDFANAIQLPQRTTTTPRQPSQRRPTVQPQLHRPAPPNRNWQYWLKSGLLPTTTFAIIVFIFVLMLIPSNVEKNVILGTDEVPVSLTTIAPTSTATTMSRRDSTVTENSPQIVTLVRQQITLANVRQIQELDGESRSTLNSSDTFIFSSDQTLFIFASPELQEVQIIDVATNDILRVIDFAPDTPLYVAFNADDTILYILSNTGISTWGIAPQ